MGARAVWGWVRGACKRSTHARGACVGESNLHATAHAHIHTHAHTHTHTAPSPHVERVERRVARLVRRPVVAAVRLVGVQLAGLAHVVEVLARVALALRLCVCVFVCVCVCVCVWLLLAPAPPPPSPPTLGAIHDAVYTAAPSAAPSSASHLALSVIVSSHGRPSRASATPAAAIAVTEAGRAAWPAIQLWTSMWWELR